MIIHTKTKAEYDELMEILEKDGYRWTNDRSPTDARSNIWRIEKKQTCINLWNNKTISWDTKYNYKDRKVIPFKEWKKSRTEHKEAEGILAAAKEPGMEIPLDVLFDEDTDIDQLIEGLRYDDGKTMFDCIPPYAEEQIAQVLTQGAKKYAARNWEKGMDWSRVINSLQRHFNKFRKGIDYDEESGLPHIAHVAVNAIFLLEYMHTHPERDDRRKYNSVAQNT